MQHVATDNVSAPAAFTGSTFSFSPPVNLFDQHKAFVAVVRRPCSSSSQVCLRQAVVNALPDSWRATYCKNYRATNAGIKSWPQILRGLANGWLRAALYAVPVLLTDFGLCLTLGAGWGCSSSKRCFR